MTGSINFRKMNGLGNDFVVLDARARPLALKAAQIAAIADRNRGIGCDQVIALELSDFADVFMRIWNADGGEVGACGNAARCVAALLVAEHGSPHVSIETESGMLAATVAKDGSVTIDMGTTRFEWNEIPLSQRRQWSMSATHTVFSSSKISRRTTLPASDLRSSMIRCFPSAPTSRSPR
jgi:diaminopimelate epimerase